MRRNLILTDGGMGDLACQLVAVDYLHKRCRDVKFEVWLPDYLLTFARHLLPKAKVYPFSQADKRFKAKYKGRTTQWFDHGHTPMRTHPVDYGFHMLADCHLYDLDQKSYLQIRPNEIDVSRFGLPGKYVCIVATAAEPVKAMPEATLRAVTDFVIGRGYQPVFIGRELSNTGFKDFAIRASVLGVDLSKGVNLVNQTDTLEAAAVIAGAKAIVGLDGGLIHLAGFTDTHIIAGYTLASPKHLAPIRKGTQTYKFDAIEPDPTRLNRYFQTDNYFYENDYRLFPGWEAVLSDMAVDKFISRLVNVLT